MTQKLKVDLPLILPCNAEDHCSRCLIELLVSRRGVTDAHIENREGKLILCVHYDPELFTAASLHRVVELTGSRVASRYRHEVLTLEHLDCTSCAQVIEKALGAMKGVLAASVNFAAERLRVDYDSEQVSKKQILDLLARLGHRVLEGEREAPWFRRYRELIVSVLSGLFLAAGLLCKEASVPLLAISMILGGFFPLCDALEVIFRGIFSIEFLMLGAAAGASMLGRWQEGALLLFLFSLGHGLEHFALERARRNIKALETLAPSMALVIRKGTEIEIPIEKILCGDIAVVKPGERIPADAVVVEGHSSVDQSAITGESLPVEKTGGDHVFAGTMNGGGLLKVEVTKRAGESTLARIIQMIEDAQMQKSPLQKFSERVEALFVPLVLLSFLLLIIVPPLFSEPFHRSLYRALSLIVAASPCALAIATPSAVLAGIARAAKEGVLIKGGVYLEQIGMVRAVAFDKTGTITEGKPRLVVCEAFPGAGAGELLAVAAGLEQGSGHPLAHAVLEYAREKGVAPAAFDTVEVLPGMGVQGTSGDLVAAIGSESLLRHMALEVPAGAAQAFAASEKEGHTTVFVAADNKLLGFLGVRDLPRPQAAPALLRLKSQGIERTLLITGDNIHAAEIAARQTGIDEVAAGLLPEDKVAVIEDALQTWQVVAMVGDGINDAPAMAHATVGIAMGSAGTDMALETSDIALMSDNLMKIPFIVGLGRYAGAVMRQNLSIAIGTMAVLIPAVLLGFSGITLAVVLHEGSTVAVVANALRLLLYREPASTWKA